MTKNRRRLARLAPAVLALLLTLGLQTGSTLAAGKHTGARTRAHVSKLAITRRKARTAGAIPPQGMFDSCSIGQDLSTCEQDLLQMHQAGMQVAVVSIGWDSLPDLSSYAAYAQSIGMSVMWEINDPGFWGGAWIGSSAAADWPAFSTACGCTETTQVLDYMIQWLAALPATYGYYAADDWTLTPDQVGGLRQYVNQIKAVDPSHMVMVGSAEGDGTTYYPTGATIGSEIYPETTSSLLPYGRHQGMWQAVQQSVTQDQRAASREGTASAFILQSFTFGDNLDDGEAVGVCTPSMSEAQCSGLLQYPSAGVQLALRNLVLEHAAPKLILWYTFSEASQGDRWSGLTSAVRAPFPLTATAARATRARRAAQLRAARRGHRARHHHRTRRHHRARHHHTKRRRSSWRRLTV